MRILFSFSGTRSRGVAEILASWLRLIIQSIEPWISSEMEKGSRWLFELNHQLEQSDVGIICLTSDNLNSPWICYEAGALSKLNNSHICTFLFDIEPKEIKLPLSQFQYTIAQKSDVKRLVRTLNNIAKSQGEHVISENDLDELFNQLWPKLESQLNEIPLPSELHIEPFDHINQNFVETNAIAIYQAEKLEGKNSVQKIDKDAINGWCKYSKVGEVRKHVIYGPYDALQEMGKYFAFYRIKISSEAPNGPLLYLEVSGGGRAGRSLHRESFIDIGLYDIFALPFTAKTTAPMEYRIRPSASIGEIWIDYVAILKSHNFKKEE